MLKNIVFGTIFLERNFYGLTRFEDSLHPKITFKAVGLYMSVTRINQKETITKIPNLEVYIYNLYTCGLKVFMKIREIVYVQGHKKGITAYRWNFLFVQFNIFRLT